jgi:hypothetical protein
MRKEVIYGCIEVPLMTRWILLEERWGKIMLHHFHRSDEDRERHDHPWNFWTLILKNGYIEDCPNHFRRLKPFRLYRRLAVHRHRVVLLGDGYGRERDAWTLVFTGPRIREWGFWTAAGEWIHYKRFLKEKRCQ